MKVMMIGAHPDDCEWYGCGTALKYLQAGHEVRFLSVCNGSGGHHEMSKAQIVERRRKEIDAVEKIMGITYDVWDNDDCEVMADLENRKRLVRYIREYKPDIIFTHRTNDYHADHRNTALLVQDSAYLLIVPNFCPDVLPLMKEPVIMYFYDNFNNPKFEPDVVIPTDDVIDVKFEVLNCHVSQVYEWLPFTLGKLEQVPVTGKERQAWLREPRVPRNGKLLTEADLESIELNSTSEYVEAIAAVKYREKLVERYGEKAHNILFAEAFQASEYGAPLTKENMGYYFPI